MPTTNDKSKKQQRKSEGRDREPDWHDHVLAGIDPADEARLLQRTREAAKKDHGFSEDDLDYLYGIRSRSK